MKTIDWDKFDSDEATLTYLKGLPRYQNSTLKSAVNRVLFFMSIVYCRVFNLVKLLYIVFTTNNGCNIDCTYCYGHYGQRKQKDFTTREILKFVDEFKSLGTRFLAMHGGESLLRKDIGEILNYTKLQGFYVSFNTNGYAVPKRINDLRCVDSLSVSLDGKKEGNDKYRAEGCYDKVIDALDSLEENNIPAVIISSLTRDTMNDIEFLAEFARQRKLMVQFNILYENDEFKQSHPDMVMSDEEIRKASRKILELKKAGYPIFWSEEVIEETLKWPFPFEDKFALFSGDQEYHEHHEKLMPCYHGQLTFNLDADGRLVTCWGQNDPDAPNVLSVGIKEAIRQVHDENQCEHCTFMCYNEQNALFDLDPKNVWNTAKNQLKSAVAIQPKQKTPSK